MTRENKNRREKSGCVVSQISWRKQCVIDAKWKKTSKVGGSIGSTMAYGARKQSSNPAWGKLVWTHFFRVLYAFLTPPPQSPIGLVQCVPSYTLSSPAF